MSQPDALLHLQEIDLQLLSHRKRLTEIAARLANDDAVSGAKAQVDAAQNALAPLRKKARDLELEIQSTGQKAQATETQLYSGKVKNTKEMRDMEAEIASLKKRGTELEDSLLDVMMAVEDREAALSDAERGLQQAEASRGDEHATLRAEQAALEGEVARLTAQREQALKGVSAPSLERYAALKPKKNHQPVALLRDGSCSVCGVKQTMAITREAELGQSLVTCLSCGRILVYRG